MITQQQYLDLLARYVNVEEGSGSIPLDADFRALGLNSMKAVDLVLELEEACGVMFPDSVMTDENFATPLVLWGVLEELAASHAETP